MRYATEWPGRFLSIRPSARTSITTMACRSGPRTWPLDAPGTTTATAIRASRTSPATASSTRTSPEPSTTRIRTTHAVVKTSWPSTASSRRPPGAATRMGRISRSPTGRARTTCMARAAKSRPMGVSRRPFHVACEAHMDPTRRDFLASGAAVAVPFAARGAGSRPRPESRPGLLAGKRAVVYGAAGAIGGAVSRAFAREGAQLFLAGRTFDKVDAFAGELSQAGASATAAAVDALDRAAVEKHLDEVVRA